MRSVSVMSWGAMAGSVAVPDAKLAPSRVAVTRSSAGSSSLVTALGEVDVLVLEVLAVQDRGLALGRPLPRGDVGVVLVVPQRLALGGLALGPEVPTAALVAVQGVDAHQLGELDEVGHPAGVLQGRVDGVRVAGDLEVGPELVADLGDAVQGLAQRSEEHTSELQSRQYLVCRLLLEKKKN